MAAQACVSTSPAGPAVCRSLYVINLVKLYFRVRAPYLHTPVSVYVSSFVRLGAKSSSCEGCGYCWFYGGNFNIPSVSHCLLVISFCVGILEVGLGFML